MEQRIDRIERAIEVMLESQEKSETRYDIMFSELKESEKLQNRILTSLEANQIVMQQELKGLRNDFKGFTRAINDVVDAFKYKIDDHETRINRLEDKKSTSVKSEGRARGLITDH